MITAIIWTVPTVLFLYAWRFWAGIMLEDLGMGGVTDLGIVCLGFLMGAMTFPATLPGRIFYILWMKFVPKPDDFSWLGLVFPPPKQVESRSEKKKRIAIEQAKKIDAQRFEINSRERELGLELTTWR